MKNPRNMVGPQIRKLRYQLELTQPQLAARCSRWGWDLSRETLAKIETQVRWISDFELVCLANALRARPSDLLPQKDKESKLLEDFFSRLSSRADS
ncbi:MAG: helix-turn-helix transcriptional regulator [Verrucomicrobia bacterium]|nr:helix-turn-helix transcriptional regulator [Verrucomicrobiota bacterium]